MDEPETRADEGSAEREGRAPAALSLARLPSGLWTLLPLALGMTGFILAYIVLGVGEKMAVPDYQKLGCENPAGAQDVAFNATSQYRLWALLICAQMTLWFAIFLPLVASLFGRRAWRRVPTWDVLLKAAALGLFLVWVAKWSGSYKAPFAALGDIHAGHASKMNFVNAVGFFVAVLAIVGVWATQEALKRLGACGETTPDEGRVKEFLALRSNLESYLLAAGVIIGAATLATGALRQAATAVCASAAKQFMVQDVLGYGLGFSLLLALLYAPAHAQLARTRAALRDALVPLPKQDGMSWFDWNGERKAVGELLHANAGLFASFAGAVSILTPLLGSLVSLLIGGKGE